MIGRQIGRQAGSFPGRGPTRANEDQRGNMWPIGWTKAAEAGVYVITYMVCIEVCIGV